MERTIDLGGYFDELVASSDNQVFTDDLSYELVITYVFLEQYGESVGPTPHDVYKDICTKHGEPKNLAVFEAWYSRNNEAFTRVIKSGTDWLLDNDPEAMDKGIAVRYRTNDNFYNLETCR